MNTDTREATYEERSIWGTCPACGAKHGEKCDPLIGFSFGVNVGGGWPTEGAHLGRLQRAPLKVRLVAAD